MSRAAPFATRLPPGSAILAAHSSAGYADSFAQPVRGTPFVDALQAYLSMRTRAPRWINRLLALRDALAGCVGMTRTDGFSRRAERPSSLAAGDPLDFFRVLSVEPRELAMALDDRHFRVVVSLYLDEAEGRPQLVVISSAVAPRSRLGRTYVALIAPFHRQVVKAMLRRLASGAA